MTWEEQYGIYTSRVRVTNGAVIRSMSDTESEAQDGAIYTFTPFAGADAGDQRGRLYRDRGRPHVARMRWCSIHLRIGGQ